MKVGIVIDNYKETEYVERLNKAGFTELDITDLGPNCKTIAVTIANADKKTLIANVVTQAEEHFRKPARHKYA